MAQTIDSPLYFPTHEYNSVIKIYKKQETPADGPQLTLIYEGQAIKQAKQTVTGKDKGVTPGRHGVYIIRGKIDEITDSFQGVLEEDGKQYEITDAQTYEVYGKAYSTEVTI